MRLIDEILNPFNLNEAMLKVKANKGASGIDKITTKELPKYFNEHRSEICKKILEKEYRPLPVRRVYIPKANGKQRPLGIPSVVDRVIQQAIAQIITPIYEPLFSDFSFGFRPNRDCHKAISQVLDYLNEGYEWVIDLDIEKYFDTVNHDKLISILRENIKDSHTLHLIRKFLQAGVMENGLISSSILGIPQGGSLSPILSNIYLDKFDKELEARGLRFVRYADDCNIIVKSDKAADRVMKSVISWLERKLFLKVSAIKTKIVRPTNSSFVGFTFWKDSKGWKCKPLDDRKEKLISKIKEVLKRGKAASQPLSKVFKEINQIIMGWINYFKIGNMKWFLEKLGKWLRHKVRVIIIKQWKKPKTIYKNLVTLCKVTMASNTDEEIFSAAHTRLGLYRQCGLSTINYLLSPIILSTPNKKKGRPGLVNPLAYYLK